MSPGGERGFRYRAARPPVTFAEQLTAAGIVIRGAHAGTTYRTRCPRPQCAGKRGEAVAVTIDADARGAVWKCHRCGWHGGVRDPQSINTTTTVPRTSATNRASRERNCRLAWAIWRETRPAAGTLTDLWLRERGIRHAIPERIRHHHALPYRHGGQLIGTWPAMVVRLDDPDGRFCGVHRTWLDGAVIPHAMGKAPVPDARKTLGSLGAAWFGPRDAAAVIAGEGCETVLAAAELGRRGLPGWGCTREPDAGHHVMPDDPLEPYALTPVACICASGLETFDPPATCRRLFIAEDDDAAGRRAAAALAKRALQRQIAVFTIRGRGAV